MSRDIEIKTSLYDRIKEENTRLKEKLQVRFQLKTKACS
jgi:dynactin complex subunit